MFWHHWTFSFISLGKISSVKTGGQVHPFTSTDFVKFMHLNSFVLLSLHPPVSLSLFLYNYHPYWGLLVYNAVRPGTQVPTFQNIQPPSSGTNASMLKMEATWYPPNRLRSVITYITIWIFTIVKTSNLITIHILCMQQREETAFSIWHVL